MTSATRLLKMIFKNCKSGLVVSVKSLDRGLKSGIGRNLYTAAHGTCLYRRAYYHLHGK